MRAKEGVGHLSIYKVFDIIDYLVIQIWSGITSGRVLNGELYKYLGKPKVQDMRILFFPLYNLYQEKEHL